MALARGRRRRRAVRGTRAVLRGGVPEVMALQCLLIFLSVYESVITRILGHLKMEQALGRLLDCECPTLQDCDNSVGEHAAAADA